MTLRLLETILRRMMSVLLVLFVLSLMIFTLARVVPGDPARMALGPSATAEQVADLRSEMGLDRPVIAQYAAYVGKAARGDLGESIVTNRPVSKDVMEFLPATLELV
ncbi:MAG: ABC transporter permease, partial [Octadecabacter sp.]